MKSNRVRGYSICKMFLLIGSFALVSSGCGKGDSSTEPSYSLPPPPVYSPPLIEDNTRNSTTPLPPQLPGPTDSRGPSATALLSQVKSIEDQLSEYGVHFETDTHYGPGDLGSGHILSVKLKVTASDSDLATLGKTPEQRDQLIKQLSDLWQNVEDHPDLKKKDDEEIMFAVMKIRIVRSEKMLPKLITVYERVLVESVAQDALALHDEDGVALWQNADLKKDAKNSEILTLLDEKIDLQKQFEDLKTSFLKGYIEDLEETARLDRRQRPYDYLNEGQRQTDPDGVVDELKKADSKVYLTAEDMTALANLRKGIENLPPNDNFKFALLTEFNQVALTAKRAELLKTLKASIEKAMNEINLNFKTVGPKIIVDPKSVAQAKVNGTFAEKFAPSQMDVSNKLDSYKSFVQKYQGKSQAPADQAEIEQKATAFVGLR